MTPDQLKTFRAIVEVESISKAASILHLSQSTVSQRLNNIEQEYNIKLIERRKGSNTFYLTREGEEFFEISKKWEELLYQAKDIKKESNNIKLTIGAVDSVHNYILKDLYPNILYQYPEIKLILRTHQSNEIYSLLKNGEIDVGFPLSERISSDFITKKFFIEQMKLITTIDLKLKDYVVDNQFLDTNDEVYIDWGVNFQEWHDKHWGLTGPQKLQTDTIKMLSNLMDGKKWAIVPESTTKFLEQELGTKIFNLKNEPPNRICYYIRKKDHPRKKLLDEIFFNNYLNTNCKY